MPYKRKKLSDSAAQAELFDALVGGVGDLDSDTAASQNEALTPQEYEEHLQRQSNL